MRQSTFDGLCRGHMMEEVIGECTSWLQDDHNVEIIFQDKIIIGQYKASKITVTLAASVV